MSIKVAVYAIVETMGNGWRVLVVEDHDYEDFYRVRGTGQRELLFSHDRKTGKIDIAVSFGGCHRIDSRDYWGGRHKITMRVDPTRLPISIAKAINTNLLTQEYNEYVAELVKMELEDKQQALVKNLTKRGVMEILNAVQCGSPNIDSIYVPRKDITIRFNTSDADITIKRATYEQLVAIAKILA